jgi:hypothetical protein
MPLEECPPVRVSVGDQSEFAVEILLPPLKLQTVTPTSTTVLLVTDGYVTFWVNSRNVFQLNGAPTSDADDILLTYAPLSLTMLLEWIVFDRAYDSRADGKSKFFGHCWW